MYQRSYEAKTDTPRMLPENYGGTAFAEEPPGPPPLSAPPPTRPTKDPAAQMSAPPAFEETAVTAPHEAKGAADFFRKLPAWVGEKLPFFASIKDALPLGALLPPRFDMEEILILGTALILFFSDSADKLYAVLLLLLLWIK